jgi:hypothetical protein
MPRQLGVIVQGGHAGNKRGVLGEYLSCWANGHSLVLFEEVDRSDGFVIGLRAEYRRAREGYVGILITQFRLTRREKRAWQAAN